MSYACARFSKPGGTRMNYRLKVGCQVVLALMMAACGDDDSTSDTGSSTATGGAGGAVSGRGAQSGAGGRTGRQGMTCPTEEPANGTTCTAARGTCMFGTRICDCIDDTSTWACWDPAECPAPAPAERAACSVVGMQCSYGRGADCACTAEGWNCGNQYCPPAEPALGSACESGDGVCPYGARTCDCDSEIWACWSASDCPATPPADRSACPLDGVICPYMGGDCECNGTRGWSCGRGVPNDPNDAGTADDAGL
jgi:hypothetical protein